MEFHLQILDFSYQIGVLVYWMAQNGRIPAGFARIHRVSGPPVKFVSFEYAGNVWKDRLSPVLQDTRKGTSFEE
jgi:hypothetical protein